MRAVTAQRKIRRLELELQTLKRAVFGKPDLSADRKVWREIKKDLKRSRARVFRRRYGKG